MLFGGCSSTPEVPPLLTGPFSLVPGFLQNFLKFAAVRVSSGLGFCLLFLGRAVRSEIVRACLLAGLLYPTKCVCGVLDRRGPPLRL